MRIAVFGAMDDTFSMPVFAARRRFLLAGAAVTLFALAPLVRADEIRLKDGRKLYGVIVAYEDNMFKIKTDFGYELIEKDKIASIIPSTPAKPEPAKKDSAKPSKPASDPQPQPAAATSSETTSEPANGSAKAANSDPPGKPDKASSKITNTTAKPEIPASTTAANVPAPASKGATGAPSGDSAAPAPPKEPEPPVNREEVAGNLYTNYTHGFRMYKAPSWNIIEEARNALPNAIVAMGTSNESTLVVVGEEKAKDSLEAAAAAVEKRLHDIYVNYRRLSEHKTTIGGLPAVDYQYRGKADDHDWSGRLVVIARGKDIFTVLAMTYADSDLIQIQENVIARSIASLDFSVH
jgi:hypothetical protein